MVGGDDSRGLGNGFRGNFPGSTVFRQNVSNQLNVELAHIAGLVAHVVSKIQRFRGFAIGAHGKRYAFDSLAVQLAFRCP